MGKGRATITNTLRLLQLPAGAQRALAERTISAGHARALLGTPDRALQEKMVEQIVAEGLTVRAVEELVRQGGVRAPGRARPPEDGGARCPPRTV
jgi:ParB family chromosome partitioning protein